MTTDLNVQTTGGGPTVLFIHGLDSDAAVWTPVIELLDDHTCVAIDLPGHGESPVSDDPARYERESLLADIDDVLADLDDPVVLVGHSLGGYLGMAHALTRPDAVAAMVLVSTGPGFRDPDARESWNQRVRENAQDYGVPEVAAAVAFHVDAMVIDRMTELTLPLALVIGDEDRAYLGANDYMEKKLPHAERTTVDGARHYVMRSHPEAVAASVRSMTAAAAG
ncbi:MAG: alpha/beta fold hydrolase [Acidimicrobiales bacterium]|jgi:pimeloyl-ACP methyl ester carboxylesterase|nr:alpha/beta fold hydrolase [Acidimicrobiales bacterium]